MIEKYYETNLGRINYYISKINKKDAKSLILLPGLSADHRLFEKQIEFFEKEYNILVWDAPGHAKSSPFTLNFTLIDKATWLNKIIEKESLDNIVLIGQSMGAYVSQMYLELYKNKVLGFISIDSAPLKKKYYSDLVINMLKHTENMYRAYPWNILIDAGSKGCSETEYGQELMKDMIKSYNKEQYIKLVGHGYKMLANAIEKDLPYDIYCSAILICGENDKAGLTKKYNEKWAKEENLPIYFIENAGHNSNTDKPYEINSIIYEFLKGLS